MKHLSDKGAEFAILGGMKPLLVLTICLFVATLSVAQTREEIDSIKAKFLESLKHWQPPPDSILQKKRQLRSKLPDSLYPVSLRAYYPLAFPSIFESAYFEHARTREDSTDIFFYAVSIGNLHIESGKIIACDPIVMQDAHPFVQRFPTGEFPVQLAIAKVDSDERVAFSRIYFSNHPVAKWEFALDKGKKQIPLAGDDFYGYGVDGGEGIFIDSAANADFTQLRNNDEDLWEAVFAEEVVKNYRNTWQFVLYHFQGHNLACFSTGFGDGTYATYVGYDASGKICRLLTDFGLVTWWKKKK